MCRTLLALFLEVGSLLLGLPCGAMAKGLELRTLGTYTGQVKGEVQGISACVSGSIWAIKVQLGSRGATGRSEQAKGLCANSLLSILLDSGLEHISTHFLSSLCAPHVPLTLGP